MKLYGGHLNVVANSYSSPSAVTLGLMFVTAGNSVLGLICMLNWLGAELGNLCWICLKITEFTQFRNAFYWDRIMIYAGINPLVG